MFENITKKTDKPGKMEENSGYLENLSPSQFQALTSFWLKFIAKLETTSSVVSSASSSTSSVNIKSKEMPEILVSPFDSMQQPIFVSSPSPQPPTDLSGKSNEMYKEFMQLCGRHQPDKIMLRFLRARKWNVDRALEMLWNGLKWRKEFGTSQILETGEEEIPAWMIKNPLSYFWGSDKVGRPVIYVHGKYYVKGISSVEENKKYAVFIMELAKDYFVHDEAEKVTIVMDMKDVTLVNFDLGFTSFLINCLESFYPESLGSCLIVNAPFLFNGMWTMVRPLLDPVVFSKIKFLKEEELSRHIDNEMIPNCLNGKSGWNYRYVESNLETQTRTKNKAFALDTRFLTTSKVWAVYPESDIHETERQVAIRAMQENWKNYEESRPRTLYHRLGIINEKSILLNFRPSQISQP